MKATIFYELLLDIVVTNNAFIKGSGRGEGRGKRKREGNKAYSLWETIEVFQFRIFQPIPVNGPDLHVLHFLSPTLRFIPTEKNELQEVNSRHSYID